MVLSEKTKKSEVPSLVFLLLRRRVETKERSDFQGSDYWSEAVYMMVIRFENFATWISLCMK
jgi:hypothetical protein